MGGSVYPDFIGTGWAFPLRTDANGGIAMVSGDRELEEAMRLILATYPGERPMRPEFGSRVRDFVFASINTSTMSLLGNEVRRALARWEPRVDVVTVRLDREENDPSCVLIDVVYTVKGANDRRNLVFPFYTIPVTETEIESDH